MINVFKFTFIQQLKSKSYKNATIIVAIVLLVLAVGTIKLIDIVSKDENKSDISSVYVYDEGLFSNGEGDVSVYESLHRSGNSNYDDVVFINSGAGNINEAADKAAESGKYSVAMEVSGDINSGLKIRVIVPADFAGEKKSPDHLASFVRKNFKYVILESENVDEKTTLELTAVTDTEVVVAGEESSKEKQIAGLLLPLASGFVLYFMLAIYGQNVARSVVLEKDSKIIENLLVVIKPYDIIFGKLLGICLFAIFQMSIWVISVIAGLGLGYLITGGSNGGSSAINKFFETVKDIAGAFSAASLLMAAVTIVTGFVLFCALAALFGSFASKSDEVPTYFSMYTMVMVFGWILPYMNGISGNDHMMNILRYIPFTSPFTVPADIVVGNIGSSQAVISMVLMLITAVIIVFIAAKVYNTMVLYRGATLKPAEIIKIIKDSFKKADK